MTEDIVILSDVDEIRAMLPQWQTLHSIAGHGPFSSAEWIAAWLDAWPSPDATPAFGCAWRDGKLVAGWPLGVSRRKTSRFGAKVQTLHMLCDDKAGYHELLIAQGHENLATPMIAAYQSVLNWSLMDLTPLRNTSANSAVIQAAEGQGYVTQIRDEITTVIADLDDGWDTYLATRSRDFRKSLRSSERKLAAVGGGYSTTYDMDGDGRKRLELAIALSARCWKAQIGTDLASDPALRAFVEALFNRMGPQGMIALHLIEIDGEAAASAICLYSGNEAIGLVTDIDERFAKLSLGRLLVAKALEGAAQRGITSFDFLRATPFWRRFASREEPLVRARIMRRGGLIHAQISAEKALRPLGKNLRKQRQLKARKRAGHKDGAERSTDDVQKP